MGSIDRLKVVRFIRERVPNPYPHGELPWQVYQSVRNSVIRVSRKHGSAGPMGEVKILKGVDDPYLQLCKQPDFWERGDSDPNYYIIPDQYNHERYLYAELYGDDPFNPGWVTDVVETLETHPGWGLAVTNIPNSYVLMFGDRIMIKGRAFGWWPNATKTIDVVRRLLRESAEA